MSREDLWLHSNDGYPILNKNKPILDFIKPEARALWKSGNVLSAYLCHLSLFIIYPNQIKIKCVFYSNSTMQIMTNLTKSQST